MQMNQIRYFLAVCEHKNFTHAARATNVSQPSLTSSIKKLEDELGGVLFLRDRAGCRLTPLGTLMLPHLLNVQQQTREAKAKAIRHVRLERVPITLGVGKTIGQAKISEAIERFRTLQPRADIELIVEDQQTLLTELREGRFDMVITASEVTPEIYRVNPLYQEGYRAVVSIRHPLSHQKSVTMEMLAATDMLDRPNCEMRDILHKTIAEHGHTLYAAYRSNHVDWLLELARKGAGCVILPETAIPEEAGLVSMPIEGVGIERQVFALRYRHQPSRPEADQLLQELARIV